MARASNRPTFLARLLAAMKPGRAGPAAGAGAALIVCRACGGDFVHPVEREATADGLRWWISVRCGGCGARREAEVDGEQAGEFDRRLARHAAIIERAAWDLERERMRRELDTFRQALRRDLIDATDFGG
jgi:hypothetical protein